MIDELKAIGAKARAQIVKDYVAFPALSALAALASSRGSGKAARELVQVDLRGELHREHRPQRVVLLDHLLRPLPRPDLHVQPGRGRRGDARWLCYVRQLLGAANIDGGPLFHLLAGNLSFQVEHHLYPDMPSSRYAEIAPRVRDICRRYGLPYNTGPLHKQLGTVHRTILRLAFPGGKRAPEAGAVRALLSRSAQAPGSP